MRAALAFILLLLLGSHSWAGETVIGDEPEKLPRPVASVEDTEQPLRNVQLGAFAGVSQRTSSSDRVGYSAAFAWGFAAEIEPLDWLSVLASVRLAEIPTTIREGGFDVGAERYPTTSFRQPALDLLGLGIGLKPTWVIEERLELYALLNLEWSRFLAKEPRSLGSKAIRSAERTGVGVTYQLGIGIGAEAIKDWLCVSLDARTGVFGQQSGTAFERLQGIDETGNIVHLGPLPRFEHSLDLLLGLSLIL